MAFINCCYKNNKKDNCFWKQTEIQTIIRNITGPTGATGPTGPEGPIGMQGEIGPTGEKGEKGDIGPAGEIGLQGVTGPTGAKGDKGEVGATGPTGARGEKGATGPTGARGEKGDNGSISNQNATIFTMASQDLTSGTPLTMSSILTNNGLVISGGNSIIIPSTGTYIVSYSINKATNAAGTDSIVVAIDENLDRNTSRPLSDVATTNAHFVMNLTEGDSVSLIPIVINARRIEANGGPSAILTVVRIS